MTSFRFHPGGSRSSEWHNDCTVVGATTASVEEEGEVRGVTRGGRAGRSQRERRGGGGGRGERRGKQGKGKVQKS